MTDDIVGELREPPVRGVEAIDAAVVVHLTGELDLYNSDELRAALGEACSKAPDRLVIDLGEVEFIDSTALGVLIEARSQLENRRAFLLAAPGIETQRALEVSGLARHFGIHDTVEAALAARV